MYEDAVNSGGGLLKDGCLALAGTISGSECVQLMTTSPTAMDCLAQVSETMHISIQFPATYVFFTLSVVTELKKQGLRILCTVSY
jgi:hypothetical protein